MAVAFAEFFAWGGRVDKTMGGQRHDCCLSDWLRAADKCGFCCLTSVEELMGGTVVPESSRVKGKHKHRYSC